MHHSVEGNSLAPRGTDYMQHAPPGNQGIVDGRPEGRQPRGSSVLLDTVVDQDASADNEADHLTAQSTVLGATSRDVYKGLGVPVQGMSSKELRHDGQSGRKRQRNGAEQFGERVADENGTVSDASERRWAVGKTEFQDGS